MSIRSTALGASLETASLGSPDQIVLSEIEHSRLQTFVHVGHECAHAHTRAPVLLKLGAGWSLAKVCRALAVRRKC